MSIFDNPLMSPENLFALSGNVLAAPNLGVGLGTGFQQIGQNLAVQREKMEGQQIENKTRSFVQKAFPDADVANMPPPVLKMYAEQAIKQRFQPKTSEFKQLDDGTYGVFDGTNFNKLGSAPKQADMPAIADEYNFAKQQGFKGSFQDYQAYKAGLNKSGFMVEQTNDGLRVVQGDLSSAPSKITESQSKDINWLTRGKGANEELSKLDAKLTSLTENTASKAGVLGNYAKSEDYQMAERAGREFLAVVLRKDSGGAITPDEYASYAPTFLPQPGDGPQVIERKRLARERFLDAMNRGLPANMQSVVPNNDPAATTTTPTTDQSATQPKRVILPDGTQGTIRRTK